jgi:hypothetical protein
MALKSSSPQMPLTHVETLDTTFSGLVIREGFGLAIVTRAKSQGKILCLETKFSKSPKGIKFLKDWLFSRVKLFVANPQELRKRQRE